MTSLLSGAPPSIEEQQQNNRHHPWVFVAVLAVLALYIYLFTPAYEYLGLISPAALARSAGLGSVLFFDGDRLFCEIYVLADTGGEKLIFFGLTALIFVWVYFSPVRLKQPSMVVWFLVVGGLIFGPRAMLGLLFAHLLVYLCHHPHAPRTRLIAFAAGVVGTAAFFPRSSGWWQHAAIALPVAAAAGFLVLSLFDRLLVSVCSEQGRAGRVIRTIVIQSPLLTVVIGALLEGILRHNWLLPVGILLFFWQWERLMMYAVDYKDGRVPDRVPLFGYLSVFLTPGAMPNMQWAPSIGQGYGYLAGKFLSKDKNWTALRGLALWGIALTYLLLGRLIVEGLSQWLNTRGVPVDTDIEWLVRSHVAGLEIGGGSVLLSTLLYQVGILLVWGGAMHFKVGLWRVLGYDVDSYYRFPFLATNLVSLWTRFTFHYREFLVRAFYYPVFFRLAGQKTWLRVAVATAAAVGVGNLVWGHLAEEMYYDGMLFRSFAGVLRTWPYFLLLTLGITVTELWLLWKPRRMRRKPWTPGWRIVLDVAAAYLTIQFYSLIHIFIFPVSGATLWDHVAVFCKGIGIG